MTGNASKRRPNGHARGIAVALAFGVVIAGVTVPAHSQTDGEAPVVEEETPAAEEKTTAAEEETTVEVFTPPLFGAPEKRVGAGTRELGASASTECDPADADPESGECGDDN